MQDRLEARYTQARTTHPTSTTTRFSVTENCSGGGTLTLALIDNNNNNQLDAGESVTMSFSDCVQEGMQLRGSMSISLAALTGEVDADTSDWSIGLRASFDDFSVGADSESYSIDVGLTFTVGFNSSDGITTSRMRGSELIYGEDSDLVRLTDFDILETLDSSIPHQYTFSYDFIYAGSDIGGMVTVVTDITFTGQGQAAPEAGKLTLTGANASKVVVEASGSGQARFSVDANGDGDFDDTGDRIIQGDWETFFT